MRDAFVLVDVVQTFEHEDGETLLESFRARPDVTREWLGVG